MKTGQLLNRFENQAYTFSNALFLADSRMILGTCSDGHIRIFDMAQRICSLKEVAHSQSITALAIRGRTLVTGSADKIAKVWTLRKSV